MSSTTSVMFRLFHKFTNSAMAWYCSGYTNTELIENLFKAGLIHNERVKEAMIGVSGLI